VTEVIADNVRFLESSKEGGASSGGGNREESSYTPRNNSGSGGSPRDNQDPFTDDGKPIDISDDDLPF
jgi:single-strand DNA-binding protein